MVWSSSAQYYWITGGEFLLDGKPIEGLGSAGDTQSVALVALNPLTASHLSGTLADGTPFFISTIDFEELVFNVNLTVSELPPVTQSVINLPGEETPRGARGGQTVRVSSGGELGDLFRTAPGSAIEVNGGAVGVGLQAVGATVTLIDGSIGDGFETFLDSKVDVFGGEIGNGFVAREGTPVNIHGGKLGGAEIRGELDITGGEIGELLTHGLTTISGGSISSLGTTQESMTHMTGGVIDRLSPAGEFHLFGGYVDDVRGGDIHFHGGRIGERIISGFRPSDWAFYGSEFRVDGVLINDLGKPGELFQLDQTGEELVLSGTLEDGGPFAIRVRNDFFEEEGKAITLIEAAIPASGPQEISVPDMQAPSGLREGQHLVLRQGGALPEGFLAGWGSRVTVSGGEVGNNMTAVGATVSISGGILGNVYALAENSIEISGGQLGVVEATQRNTVEVSGGQLDRLALDSDSVATITGGVIDGLTIGDGSAASIASGQIAAATVGDGGTLLLEGGALGTVSAREGSLISLFGGDFLLNGESIPELVAIGDSVLLDFQAMPQIRGVVEGLLTDGAYARVSPRAGAMVALTLTELPPIEPIEINVPSDPAPLSIREGQTLILDVGGVLDRGFFAGPGSTLAIHDGRVRSSARVTQAHVEISGGRIDRQFTAERGSVVRITGGVVGNGFTLLSGSTVEVTGGSIGNEFNIYADSTANIYGGEVQDVIVRQGGVLNLEEGVVGEGHLLRNLGTLNLLGGVLGWDVWTRNESEMNIFGGSITGVVTAYHVSEINFFGSDFSIHDAASGAAIPLDEPIETTSQDLVLSAVLSDGSEFSTRLVGWNIDTGSDGNVIRFRPPGATFTPQLAADGNSLTLTVTFAPEPSAVVLSMLGVFASMTFVRYTRTRLSV